MWSMAANQSSSSIGLLQQEVELSLSLSPLKLGQTFGKLARPSRYDTIRAKLCKRHLRMMQSAGTISSHFFGCYYRLVVAG